MPLFVTRDDVRRHLVVEAADIVTIEEALAFHTQQVRDGTWDYAVLYDGRLRTGSFSPGDVRRLQSLTSHLSTDHGPPGPLAIVRVDDAGFGMGRMCQILHEGFRGVGVFRSLDEAVVWLTNLSLSR